MKRCSGSRPGAKVCGHIEELIAAFRRAGHDILVVGPAAHTTAAFGSDGGFAARLRARLPAALAEMLELAYSAVAFVRLWRAYRTFRPDALYERYNLFLLAGAWLRALTGVPYVLEVNAPLVLERSLTPGLALKRLAQGCQDYVWRRADIVLPVTGVLAEHVSAAGVPAARIKTIHNGIDLHQFPLHTSGAAVRAHHGLGGKLVVGFTGFLREWHGLPAVVDVIREFQDQYDVYFLVVGDGPGKAPLIRAAARDGLEHRVIVTGLVARSKIPGYVAAFDIAIQPKATAYASPLKLFEYMGLARAIVAPDQPNVREVVSHDVNALLFTPDDGDAMRAVLRRAITDKALRLRLGAAAYATLRDRDMTWDGNAHQVVVALKSLANSARVCTA
jgi:glycosyltransferase involved in cell wall biosynthesis